MKKNLLIPAFCIVAISGWLIYGCRKESVHIETPGISTSFTEEFDSVYKISEMDWVVRDNSAPTPDALWVQGSSGFDKTGVYHGFPAYSFTNSSDEFVYASLLYSTSYYSVSSWLITPVLSVKNGDKISFYTRADTGSVYSDRLQVLINKSSEHEIGTASNGVGKFTTAIIDINQTNAVSGYPVAWTKYEYSFSGISGKMNTRVAFRYFVPNTFRSKGIGIDRFRFEVL